VAKTTRVTMPQLGESVHEGTISKWLVQPGDKVVEFEPMLEVDTDKVNAEVPAPVSGVLKEILAKEGETVQAGAEIAVVEVEGDGEAPAKTPATGQEKGAAAMPSEKAAEKEDREEKPATSQEKGAAAMPTERAAEQEDREEKPAPPAPAAEAKPAPSEPKTDGAHRFSPAVMMLASENNVDLGHIEGTGLGGRVTKKDVLRFIEEGKQQEAPARPGGQAQARPSAQPAQPMAGDEAVPLTRIRKLIAENMVRSKSTIPHAWQTQEVDMSGVVANRNANKAKFQQQEGFGLTYLPYVLMAAIQGLREHSSVNATFNETEILVHRDINLGVTVGLEDTLVVPVIRRADGLSLAGLARAVFDLAWRARNKKLAADDLSGGTFTVNNSGTFGTLFSYSVINPGQAGILTMEAIVDRPVAVNGLIGIKPMMYLCFSFDHRVLDGLQAARFLVTCKTWLQAVTAESPIY
jgi:2-oxoisovalerate dehydrogenase E2 component (dihydrolipoyl transacylase)